MRSANRHLPPRLLLALLASAVAGPASADLITVCPSGCDVPTLQSAILLADPGDTIRLVVSQPHTERDIVVSESVTIEGPPGHTTIVQAAAAPGTFVGRVFLVPPGVTVRIRDLLIRHGSVIDDGAGIYNEGDLTLERVEIRQNATFDCCDGGGIYNLGRLWLRDSVVESNFADVAGGGILNRLDAELVITDSTLTQNDTFGYGGNLANGGTARVERSIVTAGTASVGGGIWQIGTLDFSGYLGGNQAGFAGGGITQGGGSLTIHDATIAENQADNEGGGIVAALGPVTITATTFANNVARDGGAIYQDSSSSVRLHGTTFSDNRALRHGGALFAANGRRIRIASSTIAFNRADDDGDGDGLGGGIHIENCTGTCPTDFVFLRNSIVGRNQVGNSSGTDDCRGRLTSDGHNLLEKGSTGTVGVCRIGGDLSGVFVQTDPKLGVLQDNGGVPDVPDLRSAPWTRALLASSPLIDQGDPDGCTDTSGAPLPHDQRGAPRVGRCDPGAYEHDGVPRIFAGGFESGDPHGWWLP